MTSDHAAQQDELHVSAATASERSALVNCFFGVGVRDSGFGFGLRGSGSDCGRWLWIGLLVAGCRLRVAGCSLLGVGG